jgi:hypothetical protein
LGQTATLAWEEVAMMLEEEEEVSRIEGPEEEEGEVVAIEAPMVAPLFLIAPCHYHPNIQTYQYKCRRVRVRVRVRVRHLT